MHTPWNNVWVRYLTKYFDKVDDIDFKVLISNKLNFKDINGADVFICGWANELAIELSKRPKVCKKYITFARSYEVFFGHIDKINWKNFDDVIFVNKAFCDLYKHIIPSKMWFMPNAIDLDEWKPQRHSRGLNIAMVANLSHKKGIDLIPQYHTWDQGADTLIEEWLREK